MIGCLAEHRSTESQVYALHEAGDVPVCMCMCVCERVSMKGTVKHFIPWEVQSI